MANLEFNMNQPNVLNAHKVAEGWLQVLLLLLVLKVLLLLLLPLLLLLLVVVVNVLLQEITVKVIYDIIRPDGSKINLRDLDDFGCGTLWMHFGCRYCYYYYYH